MIKVDPNNKITDWEPFIVHGSHYQLDADMAAKKLRMPFDVPWSWVGATFFVTPLSKAVLTKSYIKQINNSVILRTTSLT